MPSDHSDQSNFSSFQSIQLSELSQLTAAHEERIKMLERFLDIVPRLTDELNKLSAAVAPAIAAVQLTQRLSEARAIERLKLPWQIWALIVGGFVTLLFVFLLGPAIQAALHIA